MERGGGELRLHLQVKGHPVPELRVWGKALMAPGSTASTLRECQTKRRNVGSAPGSALSCLFDLITGAQCSGLLVLHGSDRNSCFLRQ